nr:D-alanyl-D-alanine dipeptidase [Endozoicomonas sp.]
MTTSVSNRLVLITEEQYAVEIDMAYATNNNCTGKSIYKSSDCYLHPVAAQGLKRASELLKSLNMKLKVWDTFRPLAAQAELFKFMPDPNYVSHPKTGRRPHCRGVAMDLTITDRYGHELDMGTEFDDFRPLAHHGNDQISQEAQRNRLLLAGVMNIAGFETIDTEWWHYQLPNLTSYPIIQHDEMPEGIM